MDDAVRLERLLASSLNRNYGPSWLSSTAGTCRTLQQEIRAVGESVQCRMRLPCKRGARHKQLRQVVAVER